MASGINNPSILNGNGQDTNGHVNGYVPNGHSNGHTVNGGTLNGHGSNGYVNGQVNGKLNGYTVNGHDPNGYVNGHVPSGHVNGHTVNGHANTQPPTTNGPPPLSRTWLEPDRTPGIPFGFESLSHLAYGTPPTRPPGLEHLSTTIDLPAPPNTPVTNHPSPDLFPPRRRVLPTILSDDSNSINEPLTPARIRPGTVLAQPRNNSNPNTNIPPRPTTPPPPPPMVEYPRAQQQAEYAALLADSVPEETWEEHQRGGRWGLRVRWLEWKIEGRSTPGAYITGCVTVIFSPF